MDYQEIITINKCYEFLAQVDRNPLEKKSISLLMKMARQKGVSNFWIFEVAYDPVLDKCFAIRSDALDNLGIKIFDERSKIVHLLEIINMAKMKSLMDNNGLFENINKNLARRGFQSKISQTETAKIFFYINNIKESFNVEYNLKLIANLPLIETVWPYIKRYLNMSSAQLDNEMQRLRSIHREETILYSEFDQLHKVYSDYLKSVGHPTVSIAEKSTEALSRIVFYHYVAVKSMIDLANRAKFKSTIIDQIAVELVKEEYNQV